VGPDAHFFSEQETEQLSHASAEQLPDRDLRLWRRLDGASVFANTQATDLEG